MTLILLCLLIPVVALFAYGASLPREHKSRIEQQIEAPVAEAEARILDFPNHTRWREGLKAIAVEQPGKLIREESSHGEIRYELMDVAPGRIVTRIVADPKTSAFGGTWTFTLTPVGSGVTRLVIEEDGFVNPLWMRPLAQHVFGHDTTARQYAGSLAKSFLDRR